MADPIPPSSAVIAIELSVILAGIVFAILSLIIYILCSPQVEIPPHYFFKGGYSQVKSGLFKVALINDFLKISRKSPIFRGIP